ncbi:MAG: sulfite exporter TauE/SafE family protein [Desulfuromonadales bacterium]|nr:sulfite exporter TauE/SafE family protein [Desulfuromonadales bacterium]
MEITVITLLSFISAVVSSVFGFGAGMVLTPLLHLFLPLRDALGIGALVFLVTAGSKTFWYREEIVWPVYRRCLFLALFGLAAGFSVVALVDTFWLEKGFALLLLFFALDVLRPPKSQFSFFPAPVFPVAGGLLSVLIHGGGPLFLKFCRQHQLDRMQTVATIAANHFSLNILKAAFFTGTGLVAIDYVWMLLPAYVAAIVGTRLGRTLLKDHLSERGFSVGLGVMLLVLAINFLWGQSP